MYRRLFFLFPDKVSAQKAVQDLIQENISIKQMHSLAKPGVNLDDLPVSSSNQRLDMHSRIEKSLWNLNLSAFFMALFVLVITIIVSSYLVAAASLVIMVATYLMAYYYLTKPTLHLSDFHAAFEHNEILLMVDINKAQVAFIEKILHNKNPSASEEGISWTPSNLSMGI